MKNKLTDLNNYLFAQLERLDDESITGEALDEEIKRGKSIANIAAQVVANGNLQLQVLSKAHELGIEVNVPALLQTTGVN